MASNFYAFRDANRFANALVEGRTGTRRVPMDLYRNGDTYVLNADLPGIDPGSVDIDVDGQVLSIRAERTVTSAEGVTWISHERQAGSFLRQLRLGQGIDTEGISATYTNGVLSVTLPVSEKAKPRKIAVVGADSADAASAGADPVDADSVGAVSVDADSVSDTTPVAA